MVEKEVVKPEMTAPPVDVKPDNATVPASSTSSSLQPAVEAVDAGVEDDMTVADDDGDDGLVDAAGAPLVEAVSVKAVPSSSFSDPDAIDRALCDEPQSGFSNNLLKQHLRGALRHLSNLQGSARGLTGLHVMGTLQL